MAFHLISDLNDNHRRFVERVKESGVVWGLKAEDGWAICPSNEHDCNVMPFWSDEAYARRCAVKEWSGHTPTAIDIDSFIDHWLRGMHEDGMLVGTNFNADMAGLEVEPIDIAKELTE